MNTIEEEPETVKEIKSLENELFQEISHSLNDIDTQIINLLIQRKIQDNLLNNMITKYNLSISKKNLKENLFHRIETNYIEYADYLINIYNII